MPILYNCRHSGDQYRITKFDDAMNVESSYLCDLEACECPAGVRPTCRHREMLPSFIHRQHIGDSWFLDYDRGGWVQMGDEWAQPVEAIAGEFIMPPLPKGVTMISMDAGPEAIYNAIAEAVGEESLERAPQKPKAVFIRRRL